MERRELHEIWSKLIADGVADRADQAAAAAALAQDAAGWGDLVADARVDGLLRCLMAPAEDETAFVRGCLGRLAAERDGDAFVNRLAPRVKLTGAPRTRSPRRLLWALPALAAAGMAGLLVLGVRARPVVEATRPAADGTVVLDPPATTPTTTPTTTRPTPAAAPIATLVKVEGAVWILDGSQRRASRDGAPVLSGQGIVTGGQSAAQVSFHDGTVLDIGPSAVATSLGHGSGSPSNRADPGLSFFVPLGTVRVSMPSHSGATLAISTPHGESRLAHGRFALSVTARATSLDVLEGAAEIRRAPGEATTRLLASQRATVFGGSIEHGSAIALSRAPRTNTVSVIVGAVPPNRGDDLISRRLGSLGFEVDLVPATTLDTREGGWGAFVVISESVESADINTRFRYEPVPLILLESVLAPDMGMTGGPHHHELGRLTLSSGLLEIDEPTHPLAAGLSGVVRILASPGNVAWGVPSPFAKSIAGSPKSGSSAVYFGYERGSPMAGVAAPARRVAFFLDQATIPLLTEEGWQLFDAAARWCAGAAPP